MLRLTLLLLLVPVLGFSQISLNRKEFEQNPNPLSNSCPNGNENVSPVNSPFEHEVVVLLNAERKNQGKPPLKKVDLLFRSARYHAKDMSDNNYFSHDSENGNGKVVCDVGNRVSPFYNWIAVRENIANLQQTPTEVTTSWINSPGHYTNMLATDVWEIGVGYYHDGTPNTYWVENFGRRIDKFPIVINREEITTTNKTVELYIYGAGVFTEMRLKNDGESFGAWQPFKSTVSNWDIRQEKGTRTVYVELRGGPLQLPTTSYQDEIEYDGVVPNLNDAGIVAIVTPADTSNCISTFSPVVRIRNYGNVPLTTADIKYRADNGAIKTFSWTGSLNPSAGTKVDLNSITLVQGNHNFQVWTEKPNGKNDGDKTNDSLSKAFTVDPGPTVNVVEIKDLTCRKDSNGTAEVLGGGTGNTYAYEWNTTPKQTTAKATGLKAGDYEVTVADESGCESIKQVTVTRPAPFAGGFNKTNSICKGMPSGSIAPFVNTGGTPPYTYAYTTGDTIFNVPAGATSTAVTGLIAGSYGLTVIDSLGCSSSFTVSIKDPKDSLAIAVSSTPVTCASCADASATVNIIGANGSATIEWLGVNPGGTDSTISSIGPGIYIVNVTDSLGCVATDSVIISQPIGVNDANETPLLLFPNPNNGQFNLGLPNDEHFSLSLFSLAGHNVWNGKVTGAKQHMIELPNLAKGIYSLLVLQEDQVWNRRVVIQ